MKRFTLLSYFIVVFMFTSILYLLYSRKERTVKEVCETCTICEVCPTITPPSPTPPPVCNCNCDGFVKELSQGFIENNPYIASQILGHNYRLYPQRAGLSELGAKIRSKIADCMITTATSSLSPYEREDERDNCLQHLPTYLPYRRASFLTKFLYCAARDLPDINLVWDLHASHGGLTLPIAEGLAVAKKESAKVFGFEFNSRVCSRASERFAQYSFVKFFCESSLPTHFMWDHVNRRFFDEAQGNKTNIITRLTQYHPDLIVTDIQGSMLMVDNQKMYGQDLWIIRDRIKPKYWLLGNLLHAQNRRMVVELASMTDEWELVAEGTSGAVGCLPSQMDVAREFNFYRNLRA